jgi:UDP-N-acetylmuramoylalanine--D-glutamate ligase
MNRAAEIQADMHTGTGAHRYLVLGMGDTGASCARWIARNRLSAVFVDSRESPPGADAIRAALPAATLHAGDSPDCLPDKTSAVIVSPGFPLDHDLLEQARTEGIRVLSDLDIFVAAANGQVAGITGSNGKSTVASLLAAILKGAGVHAVAGGNLGVPALDLLEENAATYVLELSSFQLERSGLLPLTAAVLLNVSADHLDLHGSMSAYTEAKARIYRQCEIAIVNRDEPALAALVPGGADVIGFGFAADGQRDVTVKHQADGQWITCDSTPVLEVGQLGIKGRHNLSNAMASVAMASALGVAPKQMADGLRSFEGLAHRLQTVAHGHGVTWIDDSKATNVGAAVSAVEAISAPLIVIAGGDGKGADFAPFANSLAGRAHTVILLGLDAARIASAIGDGCAVSFARDMDDAVRQAAALANDGDVVVLAPACASLDMYANYAERGDVFAEAARRVSG